MSTFIPVTISGGGGTRYTLELVTSSTNVTPNQYTTATSEYDGIMFIGMTHHGIRLSSSDIVVDGITISGAYVFSNPSEESYDSSRALLYTSMGYKIPFGKSVSVKNSQGSQGYGFYYAIYKYKKYED